LIRLSISLVITISLIYILNTKLGPAPPLGKFLDPVNGFWANAESGPRIDESVNIPGLQQPVKILYDSLLIPHIFAENDADLFLAQGYVHARHRLWQMEFQTHAAGGRISELIGEGALDYDRGQRRKGMVFGAKNFIDNLDDSSKTVIEKYLLGVNYFIENLEYASFPFEYKLMGYAPEKWTLLKSGLLYKYMSDMLNSHERDLENTNFKMLYGKEMMDLIYPDVDSYEDPVVDKTGQWKFEPITKEHIAANASNKESITFNLVAKPDPRNGSNNWAVGPEKSATGNPILCNDMHLGLNMPSLWFYNQLNTPNMNTMGHSLPGIPLVITGFTDSIAWGFTNAQRDLVDWYLIEFEDATHDTYLLDGAYQPTKKVIEEIKIAGGKTYYDTVVYTLFGPVMYDDSFRKTSAKKGYARRWIDHDPSNGFEMFYFMNSAKNIDDYLDALDRYSSPAQNIVFASSKGNIAHKVQGKFPLRGFEEGKYLLDGTSSKNNWSQYIPNDQNAFWKNPERGFVSSANQYPADSTYPYYITATMYESYRNRTINETLRNDSSITIDDMKKLHYNNFSLKAKESLPTMLQYVNNSISTTDKQKEMIALLKEWDYEFSVDSKAATFYDQWYRQAFRDTWDEIRNKKYSLYYPTNFSFVRLMKTDPNNIFFDDKSTQEIESAEDIIARAFDKTVDNVSEKGLNDWATHKSTYVQHLSRQRPLGVYNIRASGAGGDVVNATGSNHGPSERMIVELDPEGVKAWGHYPGGQSGNPGSYYYDNMVEAWATGKYFDLVLYASPEEAKNTIFSQTLTPAK